MKPYITHVVAILAMISALTFVPSKTYSAVIADNFDLSSPNREAGDALAGTTTTTGNVTWQELWPTPLFYGTSNGYISNPYSDPGLGGGGFVSLASIATPGNTQFTLSANINPQIGTNGWVGLEFSSGISSPFNTGEILTLLAPNGDYAVYLKEVSILVASGSAPNFSSNAFNQVSINFDSNSKRLNVSINNRSVVTNYDVGTFVPQLNYAGFNFETGTQSTAGTLQVDNFYVAAVPEPSVFAMALGGIGTLVGLQRQRRRNI